ncbi:MAG: hypothetical protein RJA57_683 [Bacteroidota bacterium]
MEDHLLLTREFICIGTMRSAEELRAFLSQWHPDVVLLGLDLGGPRQGIELLRSFHEQLSGTRFLVSARGEPEEPLAILQAGARGFIDIRTDPPQVLNAIAEMHRGGVCLSSEATARLLEAFLDPHRKRSDSIRLLTRREQEILTLLAEGLMYKEVAATLFLSTETVRKHAYNIYDKLEVTNRVAAVNKFYCR